jgi:hypothetical protein
VREDYSPGGTAWDYFPHDHARSRVYRWNEDGLFGISDQHQHVCFALALWNRRDPILKERLFGLNNGEGNHGEDVKECYFYLDNVPTHSYMKALYKYPQAAYPYDALLAENRRRGRSQPEFELPDTGVFAEDRYWDVLVEYAKASPEDVLIQITVTQSRSRGGAPRSPAHRVVPQSVVVGPGRGPASARPGQSGRPARDRPRRSRREPEVLYLPAGRRACSSRRTRPTFARVFGTANLSPWVKDAFHELLIHDRRDAVNPDKRGTKAAALHRLQVPAGGSARVRLRLTDRSNGGDPLGTDFDTVLSAREGRGRVLRDGHPARALADAANVMRQAWPGCSGRSSTFTTMSCAGSRAIRRSPRRPPSAGRAGIATGSTTSPPTSSRCRTSGSTRGMRPGTRPFTA